MCRIMNSSFFANDLPSDPKGFVTDIRQSKSRFVSTFSTIPLKLESGHTVQMVNPVEVLLSGFANPLNNPVISRWYARMRQNYGGNAFVPRSGLGAYCCVRYQPGKTDYRVVTCSNLSSLVCPHPLTCCFVVLIFLLYQMDEWEENFSKYLYESWRNHRETKTAEEWFLHIINNKRIDELTMEMFCKRHDITGSNLV